MSVFSTPTKFSQLFVFWFCEANHQFAKVFCLVSAKLSIQNLELMLVAEASNHMIGSQSDLILMQSLQLKGTLHGLKERVFWKRQI